MHIYPQKHIAEKVSQYLYQPLFEWQGWTTAKYLPAKQTPKFSTWEVETGLVKFEKVLLHLLRQLQLFNKISVCNPVPDILSPKLSCFEDSFQQYIFACSASIAPTTLSTYRTQKSK